MPVIKRILYEKTVEELCIAILFAIFIAHHAPNE